MAAVTTALATGATDAATLGGAVLLLVVGIAVFHKLKGAVK